MPSNWSRRTVLTGTGALFGESLVSGCLSGSPPAGGLVIANDHSKAHTVTVMVTKTSEDDDDLVEYGETPPASPTPIWTRDAQFTVSGDERLHRKQFITETGAFYLEAQLATGERDTGWVGLYEAMDGGVAEDTIFVDIAGDGQITIFATHDD